MESIGMLGMLGVMSLEDIKRKRVGMVLPLVMAMAGIVFHMVWQKQSIYDIFGGFLIGAAMLLISHVSSGAVGSGDAVLFMVTGIYLGFFINMALLFISLVLAAFFGLFGIIRGRFTRKSRLPFLPFVLAGYVVILIVTGGKLYG